MLTQLIHLSNSSPTYFILDKPSLRGINHPSFQVWSRPSFPNNQRKQKRVTYGCTSSSASKIKAVAVSEAENKKVKVKATITVQPTVGGFFAELGIDRGFDDIQDLLGKSLLLELVSTTLDPSKCITTTIFHPDFPYQVSLFLLNLKDVKRFTLKRIKRKDVKILHKH